MLWYCVCAMQFLSSSQRCLMCCSRQCHYPRWVSSYCWLFLLSYYYCYYYNHFMALWILSGTTRVSWYQKGKTRKVKPIWIYWSKR